MFNKTKMLVLMSLRTWVTETGAVLARSSQPLVGLMMNMRRYVNKVYNYYYIKDPIYACISRLKVVFTSVIFSVVTLMKSLLLHFVLNLAVRKISEGKRIKYILFFCDIYSSCYLTFRGTKKELIYVKLPWFCWQSFWILFHKEGNLVHSGGYSLSSFHIDWFCWYSFSSFRKLYIVDARPRKNALANGAKGGGSESSSNYSQSEVCIKSWFSSFAYSTCSSGEIWYYNVEIILFYGSSDSFLWHRQHTCDEGESYSAERLLRHPWYNFIRWNVIILG